MSPRRSLTFALALFTLFLFPTALQAQRSAVCATFHQSVQSFSSAGGDHNAYIQSLKTLWQRYQHADKLPKSQLTYQDKTCLVLWSGMVQGFPPEQLEAAGISIEPDLAWMVIDAYLDRAQRGLRQARAKQDAEWEQGCLRELEVLSKAQENLRPNLLRVVIINKDDSRNESDWVPVAQVTSRTAVATLIDVAIPVKLYSNEHELIWEGRFTFARVEPSGGNVIDRGIGKLLLSKAVADIEVGDVQFTFEHRTR